MENCHAGRIVHGWNKHFTRIALLQLLLLADMHGGAIPRTWKKFQSEEKLHNEVKVCLHMGIIQVLKNEKRYKSTIEK